MSLLNIFQYLQVVPLRTFLVLALSISVLDVSCQSRAPFKSSRSNSTTALDLDIRDSFKRLVPHGVIDQIARPRYNRFREFETGRNASKPPELRSNTNSIQQTLPANVEHSFLHQRRLPRLRVRRRSILSFSHRTRNIQLRCDSFDIAVLVFCVCKVLVCLEHRGQEAHE